MKCYLAMINNSKSKFGAFSMDFGSFLTFYQPLSPAPLKWKQFIGFESITENLDYETV